MTEHKRQKEADRKRPAGRQPGEKRQPRVVGAEGPEVVPWAKREPPAIRVIKGDDDERLTTEELKRRFARNLDRLLGLLGTSRKDAADEIGIPYPLLRRLVSAGVSRTDERGEDDLQKIAAFFALSAVADLWRADLLTAVLDPAEDNAFIKKFRSRLLAERQRRMTEAREATLDEISLLNRALGFREGSAPSLVGPYADMVAVVLASPKADRLKAIIEDYYELVTRSSSHSAEQHPAKRSASQS